MTITNTMATMKALTQAGVPQAQAETMAALDEQHAADAADHIATVLESRFAGLDARFAGLDARFAHLEPRIEANRADFHATVRQQTWAIIAFGFAVAGVAVTIATLLHR